ncbi:MAG TPA: hypothetical protein VKD26_07695 [Streptosporangiaceae bacterium]|nr:hypothetical protein [Streptosporangiaceae bacterium]HXL18694.1 hypothetical protein [Streptosporangiaceae bacterium]
MVDPPAPLAGGVVAVVGLVVGGPEAPAPLEPEPPHPAAAKMAAAASTAADALAWIFIAPPDVLC